MKSFEMIDFINRNVIPMAVGEMAYRSLKNNGVNFAKNHQKNTPWCEP